MIEEITITGTITTKGIETIPAMVVETIKTKASTAGLVVTKTGKAINRATNNKPPNNSNKWA